jgi:hypothetical protein
MASIRKVDYFRLMVSDKPGQGASIMQSLADAGVNLLAFTGFPNGRRAQLDLIPENTAKLRAAAKEMKLKLGGRKTVFLLRGDDRVGALTKVLNKLAEANVNVTAVDAVSGGQGRFGAILWVKPDQVGRTSRLLKAK